MRLVVKVSLLTSDSLLWYKTKLPRSLSFSLPAIYWLSMTLGKWQNFSRLLLSYQTFPHQLWNKSWGQISPSPCWSDDGQEPQLLAQRVETHCAAAPPQDRKRHSRRTKRVRQDAGARDHSCCIFGNQSQDTWFRGKEELWMSQSGFKLTLPPFFFLIWTIFQICIDLIIILCFHVLFWFFDHKACGILASQAGIKPALEHAKLLQLYLTLCDPMGCSPPGSSVHGILQARILEWVSMPSSRGSSQPRDQTCLLCHLHWQAGSFP